MSSTTEETLETLPRGHPESGYISPAIPAPFQTGTVPPVEQEAFDASVAAQEAEAAAVAQHEHDVATATEPTAKPIAKSASKSNDD